MYIILNTRPEYKTRTIVLATEQHRLQAYAMLVNMPYGTEVVGREISKARKPDQSSLMWAGPLRDIEQQAWVNGRQFTADTWHEYFKMMFAPEDDDPELDSLVIECYRKWSITPDGTRVCTASTKKMKSKGMARYLDQIHAFGGDLGVRFTTPPVRMAD